MFLIHRLVQKLPKYHTNVLLDCHAFMGYLFRNERMLRIDSDIKCLRPLIDHVHERFFDKHGGHHAHSQFQEQSFPGSMLPQKIHVAFHFTLVKASLQETVATHPGFHFCSAVRTTGNQFVRQGIVFNLFAKGKHLFLVRVNPVVTRTAALPVTGISLDAGNLLSDGNCRLWEYGAPA